MLKEKIEVEEKELEKRIKEALETKDTFLRRAFLNIALRQNDLIYSLHQQLDRGGR